MNFDKNIHLREVLDTHKMHHVQDFVDKVKNRREEIKAKMHDHYGSDKYSSFGSGSFAKHTATNVKFDLDLVEPFKHCAFNTLQEMFDSVHDFLVEEYKNTGVTIRKQKVSIGVSFPTEEGDDKPVELDVVPGRELKDDDYPNTHDLNLCFNEDHWGFKKGTYQKTNIQKQISHIAGKSSERQIIRLLKIWKKQKGKNYKSFVIELAVIKALEDYNGDNGLWPRLKYTMEYLRDHIADSSFHLYDPGNTNNDVIAAMADYDRQSFKSDMESMLNNIDCYPDFYLPYYFKVNEKYSGYKKKESGAAFPTSPKRFGLEMMTADKIKELIVAVEGVGLVDEFILDKAGSLIGRITVDTGHASNGLIWEVEISPSYPFKAMGVEPIRFVNKSLLDYSHIMQGGNLCMHPAEYENAESQFVNDLEQLREWVDRYYVKGEKDEHYEHLVVNHYPIREKYFTFCFAETREDFEEGDYGEVRYATLAVGHKNDIPVANYVVQKFVSVKQVKKKDRPCVMSEFYQKLRSFGGVYCLLSEVPSVHNKFIVEDYDSIKRLFSQGQKNYIHEFVVSHNGEYEYFPLFCGYRIPDGGIHWQAMIIFMDDLPIEPVRVGTGKNRLWFTEFRQGPIQWVETVDISYKYFFGRGAMPAELANKKVLIMGVGAIGSIVAETLTRCGSKNLTLCDIDNKEPGNVCRSAYPFYTGVTEKTLDLESLLTQISPHVDCAALKSVFDAVVKRYAAEHDNKTALAKLFDEYDVIFDCTTDNQLMRVIDATGTKAQVVNLSITNHAQDLICAFSPNVTAAVLFVYGLLKRDSETDMYNPTGCWNPTFKASYNDIESKVQFAMKHVIRMLSSKEPLSNFYITEDDAYLKIHRL